MRASAWRNDLSAALGHAPLSGGQRLHVHRLADHPGADVDGHRRGHLRERKVRLWKLASQPGVELFRKLQGVSVEDRADEALSPRPCSLTPCLLVDELLELADALERAADQGHQAPFPTQKADDGPHAEHAAAPVGNLR